MADRSAFATIAKAVRIRRRRNIAATVKASFWCQFVPHEIQVTLIKP